MSAVGWVLRISRVFLRVSSAAWPVLIALDRVRLHFSKKSFHKGSHLWYHIQSYPWSESPGGYQIHIRNLTFLIQSQNHKNFDPFDTCLWKTCSAEWLCFSYGYGILKNLRRTGANFISSLGSKVKSLIYFSFFWPIHVITLGIFFRCSQIKIKLSMRYIADKWESLRRF